MRFSELFLTGASTYADAFPGRPEPYPRIYVQFRIEGVEPVFLALLDTGGCFCILNDRVATLVKGRLVEPLDKVSIRTAHGILEGNLYRHQIALVAEDGEPLDVHATVFVPPVWSGPCFLGYSGALDRVRFAVDPEMNRFYFGTGEH